MKTTTVILRHCDDVSPSWQYYGIEIPVVGGAETLQEARDMASEAVCFYLETEAVAIDFHLEWRAFDGGEDEPSVYVRTRHDDFCPEGDTHLWQKRSAFRDFLLQSLKDQPARRDTFDGQVSGTGDVIAVATLPEDLLANTLNQVSQFDNVFLGMRLESATAWIAISGSEAECIPAEALPIADVGITADMTIREFMEKAGVSDLSKARTLLAA